MPRVGLRITAADSSRAQIWKWHWVDRAPELGMPHAYLPLVLLRSNCAEST